MGRSSYPGEIDSDVELPRVDDNISEVGGDAINSLRDAIFSIENAIGVNPQGNTASLVTRVNSVIDADGTIKTSALITKGLIALPISDSQIGDGAAIQEVKLDLDFGTSFLNNRITTNAADLESFRTSFNANSARSINHFNGIADRHDGYDIDLTVGIRSSDDVETALNVVNNAFTAHQNSETGAHAATGISVNDEFQNISAIDVQGALVELDNIGLASLEIHQDNLHVNGVSVNTRGEQGIQGNLKETVLAGSIFQTETSKATNIYQVMRPNVARVTSVDLDIRALEVGVSNVLRIEAGGIGRTALDVTLSAIIPTDNLDDVVDAINTKAQGCDDHYPISAYNVGGRLVIAHNIPGKEFTVQIKDDVQFSAATTLGFGSVTSTVFEWSGTTHAGYVGGKRIPDLKSLVKVHHNHTTRPLNTLALGLGDLSTLGISIGNEGRIIVNVTNHSTTPTDNGTHYILAFPNSQSIVLSSDIQNGEFDLEIPANSVNFENSASGEVFDIFVEDGGDGYGTVTKSLRVSYGPLSGVTLREVSKDFPTTSLDWQIIDSSVIQLFENNEGGVQTTIPTGFQGQLRVFAPDNINDALFEVTGVPTSGRKSMDVSTFAGTDDRLHVGSVHYSGNFGLATLKFSTDSRLQGAMVDNKSEDKLDQVALEDVMSGTRNNGVIRGFEIVSSDQLSFRVRGGDALVDGRLVKVETKDVTVDEFGAASRLVLLDRDGNYIVKSEFDAGFAFADLTAGDGYGDDRGVAIIAEFETNGTEIDGYFLDRRLIVGNIDKRLVNAEASLSNRIDQVQNSVAGSLWGFTEASASGSGDGYIAGIEPGDNNGFTYISAGVTGDNSTLSARGFSAGLSPTITTRRFEFSDPDTIKTSIFKAVGMTHINIFAEFVFTGLSGGPFGVSGASHIELGVVVETGISTITVADEYARVKTINTGVLPSDSVTERHVASIPITELGLADNVMFDFAPRVRILNSTFIDGGTGSDKEPTIRFNHIRVVTSSYSIAGNISELDGTSTPLAASIGEVL